MPVTRLTVAIADWDYSAARAHRLASYGYGPLSHNDGISVRSGASVEKIAGTGAA